MVLRTTLIVIGVIFALGLFAVGVMAALGMKIYIDFSSPGPLGSTTRPELEAQDSRPSSAEDRPIMYIEDGPRFRFAN